MDKFNDMWKNRFNDGNMPIADWNTPDDEVWDAILPHVVEEKKNRFIWWLFLVLGGILILFLMLKTSQDRRLHISSFPVKTLSEVEKSKVSSQSDNAILISSDVIKNNSAEALKSKRVEDRQSINNDVSNTQQIALDQGKQESPILRESRGANKLSNSHVISRADYAAENLGKEDEELSNKEMAAKPNTLPVLDLLPTLQFMLKNSAPILIEMPKPTVLAKIVEKREKISVGFAAGAMFWNHRISGAYQNDLAPFDFNYTDNVGAFIAAEIGVPLSSKWRLFTGVQYEQVTTTSGHNSSIEYDKALENTTPNNDYDLGLATPYGISAANFVLDRDVQQVIIDDSVPLLVDFHSNHKIKNLSIPLGIEFTPWSRAKSIVPSFKVGGGINYITDINNELDAIDTHHGAISFNRDASMNFDAPTIEQLFFDIQMGVETSISLSKTLQLQFEYTWKKGLNPIFKQSDYNTTINRHFLSAGLSKTFGK